MANICDFSAHFKGTKEGCGAVLAGLKTISSELVVLNTNQVDDERYVYSCEGDCRWSVESAMLTVFDDPEWFNLLEACKANQVDCEIYSSEPGSEFQEHFRIEDGELVVSDVETYKEIDVQYYREESTRKQAERDLGRKISDDEWESDDFISNGGFYWDFKF